MSGTLRGILREARNPKQETETESRAAVAPEPSQAVHEPIPVPTKKTRPVGKSQKEDYERLTIYLKKKTKANLVRHLADKKQDMSEFIQELLAKHLDD